MYPIPFLSLYLSSIFITVSILTIILDVYITELFSSVISDKVRLLLGLSTIKKGGETLVCLDLIYFKLPLPSSNCIYIFLILRLYGRILLSFTVFVLLFNTKVNASNL